MPFNRAWRRCVFFAAAGGLLPLAVAAQNGERLPTAAEVMDKVIELARWVQEHRPALHYTYRQQVLVEKMDGDGAVKEREERIYQLVRIEGEPFGEQIVFGNRERDRRAVHRRMALPESIGQPVKVGRRLQWRERRRVRFESLVERQALGQQRPRAIEFAQCGVPSREQIQRRSTIRDAWKSSLDPLNLRAYRLGVRRSSVALIAAARNRDREPDAARDDGC